MIVENEYRGVKDLDLAEKRLIVTMYDYKFSIGEIALKFNLQKYSVIYVITNRDKLNKKKVFVDKCRCGKVKDEQNTYRKKDGTLSSRCKECRIKESERYNRRKNERLNSYLKEYRNEG